MSTKELTEQTLLLLTLDWKEHEKTLIKRLTDSLISYKLLLPKSLKQDIKDMLLMATNIKIEYENLMSKHAETVDIENVEKEESKLIE